MHQDAYGPMTRLNVFVAFIVAALVFVAPAQATPIVARLSPA